MKTRRCCVALGLFGLLLATPAGAQGLKKDPCGLVGLKRSQVMQLLEVSMAKRLGSDFAAQHAPLVTYEYYDACSSTVAVGSETRDEAFRRIVQDHYREWRRIQAALKR